VQHFGLVVIGAHSGVHLKSLITSYIDQKILLIEPVPYNYKMLKEQYGNYENIFICENAILDKAKKDNFFFVNKSSISKLGKHWASQIGSFDKNHILNHKNKRFNISEKDIETAQVKFITFTNLMEKYSIKSIEKLQIDVEGAEYKIMSSIDYKEVKIDSILFEFKHFDGTFTQGDKLKRIKNILIENGYSLSQIDKENILAKK
tara:strand:- start:1150 stop:1761 length:612 start_codon:yes stop_codon:yes gene_type:complete